jgi:hypothetical protein
MDASAFAQAHGSICVRSEARQIAIDLLSLFVDLD